MRNSFVNRLYELAKEDKDIILLTADLGYGVLSNFYDNLKKQFINVGIAEQNMASIAASLGLDGKKPYIYSIGNFTSLRCLEQIRNDILYHNSNVKIISVGSGFGYGQLGMSHHATEDMAIMRALPNIIIFTPSDKIEAEQIADLTLTTNTPAYIRLSKGNEPVIHNKKIKVKIGKAIEVMKGQDVVIFVAGSASTEAYEACKELNKKSVSTGLYSFPTIKPIDKKLIKKVFNTSKVVLTVEDNNMIGGLYSAVSEVVATENHKALFKGIGLNDEYTSIVGSQNYLRKVYKINKDEIVKQALKLLNKIERNK
jgi:transketolase